MKRDQCVFWAPLDTVLRPKAERLEPLLRFFALFTRHVAVTDTQLLDSELFRNPSITEHLDEVFEADSGDNLPFILVSKRRGNSSLREIVLHDMVKMGIAGTSPMHFSSFSQTQQHLLEELRQRGALTERSLEVQVRYPLTTFVDRISTRVDAAGYADQLTWPPMVQGAGSYFRLTRDVLSLSELPKQAGIRSPRALDFLEEVRHEVLHLGANQPGMFSRTAVYHKLSTSRNRRKRSPRLTKIPGPEFETVLNTVRAATDYCYLRNMADRSSFQFLLDGVHWLPSSVVNRQLAPVRPGTQAADTFVERCLNLQEGAFHGYGSDLHRAIVESLRWIGFAEKADWRSIVKLRSDPSFFARLNEIDEAARAGDQTAFRKLMTGHLKDCLARLITPQFDWASNFWIGTAVGIIGWVTGGAIGFVTAGGGAALLMAIPPGLRRIGTPMLVDTVSKRVVDAFEEQRW